MAIPEEQLTTWAQIGAQETSKTTYATVKLALEDSNAGYHGKKCSVFLQGSYGNDTNIRKESDVDVVIRLDAIFTYDIVSLPEPQKAAFKAVHPDATYTHVDFRRDVLKVLTDRFESDVEPGTKAVVIKPRHTRRKADVLISTQHRKYSQFTAIGNESKVTGISFHKSDGSRVANYPEQHRDNLTAKNQSTNEWFKHIVRIFKNARQKLVEDGIAEAGVAPSYYIEGLLHNVPDDRYGTSYAASVENVLRWLVDTDRSQFKCAHGQYLLLDGHTDVSWNTTNCDAFLNGVIGLWNDW